MKFKYSKIAKGLVVEPNCTEEWLQNIIDIGCDYDGCGTVEHLKKLIDELVECAASALDCLRESKVFESSLGVLAEQEASYKAALEEKIAANKE